MSLDQQPLESVEPRLPEGAVVLNPSGRFAEGRRRQAQPVLAPADRAFEERRLFEDLHVLGYAIERHREPAGERADVYLTAREHRKNRAPRRIRDCAVHPVQTRVVTPAAPRLVFNHQVE